MDGRMKTSRDLSPDLSKVAMQPRQKQTRKVQVVYYLSRGGQLEHPHFMEVTLPYNQGMRLRDVMDRLTSLRGKGMPTMFSWSCKRSYKSGYVWNDLAEDDVICPADGVEYVLKGSELFEGCSERYQEFKTSSGRHASEGAMVVCSQERTMSNSKAIVPIHSRLMTEGAQNPSHPRLNPKVQYAQNVSAPHSRAITREEGTGTGIIRSETPHYLPRAEEKSPKPCLREYKVFKSEPVYSTVGHGADAATQTSEDIRTCTRGVSTHQQEVEVEEEEAEEQSKERECTQNPTELSAGDQSPPSSSTSSSSEAHAHHNISSRSNDEAAQLKPASIKSVRFEEPIVSQSSRFSLLQLISCGSLVVEDNNVLTLPHKPGRIARTTEASSQGQPSPSPKKTNQSPNNNDDDYDKALNRTLAEEFDTLSFANAQIAEKEYFSGSFVEMKTKAEEDTDPTLNRSASFNAERGSKLEMGGASVKEGDHHCSDGAKTKCIPRLKSSRKESKNNEAPRTTSNDLMSDRNSKGSWSNRFP